MSKHEKLLNRLQTKPTDFGWNELERLLSSLGYEQEKGDGSRRKFIHSESKVVISLHQPHPSNVLKQYQVKEILAHMKEEGSL